MLIPSGEYSFSDNSPKYSYNKCDSTKIKADLTGVE
jgi:hypothetical protein